MTSLSIISWMVVICVSVSDASYYEKKLLNDLFNDYKIDMRPVLHDKETINVTIGLSLSQIIGVDEKHQIVTTSVWIRQKWYNPYFRWNKTEYGNITTINVQSSKVWLPDLVLYNNADESVSFRGNLDQLSTRVQLFDSGNCLWLAPVMLRSKCRIDVEFFPFDSQICIMKFGSWTYGAFRLDVQRERPNVDLLKYAQSTEWHLASATAKRNSMKYSCCPEPYSDVTFYFHIQRRTLFYLSNLILPLVVLSVLIIFVFTLPPESGERISLSITILLAMTVFMLLVTDTMPPTSEVVPLIAKFYMAVMFEMALALLITCYVLRCYNGGKRKMPPWMKKYLVGKMAHFFGVQKSEGLLNKEREEQGSLKRNNVIGGQFKKIGNDDGEIKLIEEVKKNENGIPQGGLVSGGTADRTAEMMLEKLEIISNDVEEKGKEDLEKEQWRVLSTVIDRLAMWGFAILIGFTMLGVFSQSPGYVA